MEVRHVKALAYKNRRRAAAIEKAGSPRFKGQEASGDRASSDNSAQRCTTRNDSTTEIGK